MLNNSPDVGRAAFDFIESMQRVSATGGITDGLRAVLRRSMPDRLQARVGKFEYVRLAAMTAAFQQFGRFRSLQIISRVDDAGVDFLSRLHADQRQPADGWGFLHLIILPRLYDKRSDLDQKKSGATGCFLPPSASSSTQGKCAAVAGRRQGSRRCQISQYRSRLRYA
jgi:hypothetical protein